MYCITTSWVKGASVSVPELLIISTLHFSFVLLSIKILTQRAFSLIVLFYVWCLEVTNESLNTQKLFFAQFNRAGSMAKAV